MPEATDQKRVLVVDDESHIVNVVSLKLRNAGQHRLGELLPDHRRRLEQPFLALGEAIDPRGEHRLHRGGELQLLHRPGEPVSTAAALETSHLHQRLGV